jgi:hypothetical protein
MLSAEIVQGGIGGACGLDQWKWNGPGGEFYNCWTLSPCCGAPDGENAICCILHWACLGPFTFAHMHGSSVGNGCTLMPSCLFAWFCPPCAAVATRYNYRKKANTPGNILGDTVCALCLAPCSHCQVLRTAAPNEWRFWPCPPINITGPMRVLR